MAKITVLKKFYDELNDVKKKRVREKIIKLSEISTAHFYHRLRKFNFKWKAYEKAAIAKALKKPVEELFPINGKAKVVTGRSKSRAKEFSEPLSD